MKPVFYFTKTQNVSFIILESDIKYQFVFKINQEKQNDNIYELIL